MDVERRFAEAPRLEKRADGSPLIVGYAAVFSDGTPSTEFDLRGNGTVYEQIVPGAFDQAMREARGVVGLFNHDPSLLLGRVEAGTLRMTVDKRGLMYEIDPPDTQLGRDLQTLIARGDIKGSSFTFRARQQEFVHEQRSGRGIVVRKLQSVEVRDVGPVTFAAYGAADVEIAQRMLTEYERANPWRLENAKKVSNLASIACEC